MKCPVYSHRGSKLRVCLVEDHLETDPNYWVCVSSREAGMLEQLKV